MYNSQRFSLSDVISYNIELTEIQVESFIDVFGKHCQQRTKSRLRSVITYRAGLSNYDIYNRVMFTEVGCSYVPRQSYPDEVRTVRRLIIGG
jgi:hypothetical protein